MAKIKNISVLKKIYSFLLEIIRLVSPSMNAKIRYFVAYGKACNLKNPETFSEKLLWLSLNTYNNNDKIMHYSDKYLVREYVQSKNLYQILNKLYYVWRDPNDIIFKDLPDKFVIKLSQGCSTNIICKNKKDIDLEVTKKKLKKWDKGQFFYDLTMSRIGGVKQKDLPKYYICEKYLEQEDGSDLIDYKFYCFNGIPQAILVISDRFGEKTGAFMSLEWEVIASLKGDYKKTNKTFNRPKSLNKMIEVAKILSESLPFVRVDLYDVNGKVIFGEITLFPNGCINMQETIVDGKSMGDLLDISKE